LTLLEGGWALKSVITVMITTDKTTLAMLNAGVPARLSPHAIELALTLTEPSLCGIRIDWVDDVPPLRTAMVISYSMEP